jgi:hypothetical protein
MTATTRRATLTDTMLEKITDHFYRYSRTATVTAKRHGNKEYTLKLTTDGTTEIFLLRTRDHKYFWSIVAQAKALLAELLEAFLRGIEQSKAFFAQLAPQPAPMLLLPAVCASSLPATVPAPVAPSKYGVATNTTLDEIKAELASQGLRLAKPDEDGWYVLVAPSKKVWATDEGVAKPSPFVTTYSATNRGQVALR